MKPGEASSLITRLHDPGAPPLIMGILNLTPNSFSDGGRLLFPDGSLDLDVAVERARQMVAAGAEILDLGGESTRPGAEPVTEQVEARRVLPLLEALAGESIAWLSIDTQRAAIARAAVASGAALVNDVSAGGRDPDLWPFVCSRNQPYVLTHMQGVPATMQQAPRYHDVLAEVANFLLSGVERLVRSGLERDRILLDPGIGFGKRPEDNRMLIAGLASRMKESGHPLVLGASRKSFISHICELNGAPAPGPGQRLGGSLAAALHAVRAGYRVLRVHDVAETAQALQVSRWLESASWS